MSTVEHVTNTRLAQASQALAEEREQAAAKLNHANAEIKRISDLNIELRAQLADWENGAKGAMDESCDLNAKHCTCVPLLRAQIKKLVEAQGPTVPEVADHLVIEAMAKYGGGFVTSLANTWRLGDWENKQKLKNTFPQYWASYTAIVKDHENVLRHNGR